MNNYETTLILDSQLPEDQIDGRIQKTTAFLRTKGAEIVLVERWGLRKLAYEVGKRQQGVYVLIQFRANGDLVRELDQMCGLDEGILRHMTLVRKRFVTREEAIRQEAPGGDRPKPVEAVRGASEEVREEEDVDAEDEEEA